MERLMCIFTILMLLECSTGTLGGLFVCITGFTNQNLNTLPKNRIPYEQRRIIPRMSFNCSGVISGWKIRAKWRTDGMRTSFPHLQIWRKYGSDSTYFFKSDTELFVSNGNGRSEGDYTFSGTLEPPLKFEAGDVLGMFQPPESRSRVGVYYDNRGPPNYYTETGSAQQPPLASVIATILSSNRHQNGLPLLSVDVAPDATINTTSNNSVAIVGEPYFISCQINTTEDLNASYNITWIAQNNSAVATLTGSGSTLTHSFTASLNDAGLYVCKANVTSPYLNTPRFLSGTVNVTIQIPTPALTMTRDPDTNVTLRHGDPLTLTCTIQLDPAVDSDVIVTGRLRGPRGSASSPTMVSDRTYQITLMIDSLHGTRSSTYTCTASITPNLGDVNFAASKNGISELDITVVSYTPPPGIVLGPNEYRAASGPVTVTCTAIGETGNINYQWSSTCRDCPFQSSKPESTRSSIRRGAVHSGDTGIHTCMAIAADSENVVRATINITVIGAGIHAFSGIPVRSHQNNGIITFNPNDRTFRLRLFCRSDSMMENVGIFIGLDGSPIATHNSTFFEISNLQPGEVTAVNFVANSTDLTASGQGVYTCRIPLESGEIREINIGIYPGGFNVKPGISNLVFSLGLSFSNLTCISTGSPATNVTWTRDGSPLSIDGNTYQVIQTVTNRSQSTYENVLVINDDPSNVIQHSYVCFISNMLGATSSGLTLTAPLYITNLKFVLGAAMSNLTCTSTVSPATIVIWRRDGQRLTIDGGTYRSMQTIINEAASTYENVLIIRDTLSEIVNHTYTCIVENVIGSASKDLHITALTVSITVSYTPPPGVVLGPNEYRAASGPVTVTCTVIGARGPVSYQWSSTCRDCTFQTSTQFQVHIAVVRSGDTGTHMCTATDQTGNFGNASIEFSTVGAGIRTLYGLPTGFLPNNSLVVADDSNNKFHIQFLCISNSMRNVRGAFIGPRGNFITNEGPFNTFNPHPNELEITVFPNDTLTPRHHGIYTCRIHQESRGIIDINIGVYSAGFRTPPRITNFVFIPGPSSSTLMCTSTGSPATMVSWRKDGKRITIDGDTYRMLQIAANKTVSTYENVLMVHNQLSSIIQHHYVCHISNTLGTASSNLDLTVSIVNIMQSGEPIAGKPFSLSCNVVIVNNMTLEIGQPVIEILAPTDINGDNFVHTEDLKMTNSSVTYIHTVHFATLQASHGGKYLCKANVSLLTVTDELALSVKFSTPILSMSHDPDINMTLRHGDALNLTCNVQLDPAVDINVALEVVGSLSGQGIQNPSGTGLQISERVYQIKKTVVSLEAKKSAAYTCCAAVSPNSATMKVIASEESCSMLNITVELAVNITVLYTPPPGFTPGPQEYRAASGPVYVTCTAVGGRGSLSYQWSFTCRDCPFQSTKPQSTQRVIGRGATHSGDIGIHTCRASDEEGNFGSENIKFNVVGAGIHTFNGLPSDSHPNNGLVVANDSDYRFRIRAFCRSDSMMNNVGELIGPEGNIIRTSEPFNISHPQPGELLTIVFPNTTLTHRHQGVYTCRIPLASGVVNEINIGFYPSGFTSKLTLQSAPPTIANVIFSAESSSSMLTCTSTGSPATNVTWTVNNGLKLKMRDGDSLTVDMVNYRLSQTVISRQNSTYANKVIINTTSVGDITGYRCEVKNVLGGSTKGIELGITILTAGTPRLGEDYTLTCRVSGISNTSISFEWLGPGIAPRTAHPQLSLGPLILSKAGEYTCIATASVLKLTASEEVIIAIPSPTVGVTHDGGSPIYSGSVPTLTCIITLDEDVIQYEDVLIVTSRWHGPHGYLVNGTGITITSAAGSDGRYTSTVVLEDIRDAGAYSCEATVRHSTSQSVTDGMNINETVIDIQAPTIALSLTSNTTRLPNVPPYNIFFLTCTATAPKGVVSPKTFTWWRNNSTINTDLTEIYSNEAMNITYSSLEQPVSTSMLRVIETIAGNWSYLCKVVLNNIENTSNAHSIYVTGPAGPNPPIIVASTITPESATICLFVPFITFTPETYVMHYWTNMTTFDSIATSVESTNFTAKNFKVSITLRALIPNTKYFYLINVSNTEASVISPTEIFRTEEDSSCDNTIAIVTGSVAGVTLLVVLGTVVVTVFMRKHSDDHGKHTTAPIECHNVAKEEESDTQTVVNECVQYHQVEHQHGLIENKDSLGTECSEEHPSATERIQGPVYENVPRFKSPAIDNPSENVYEVFELS